MAACVISRLWFHVFYSNARVGKVFFRNRQSSPKTSKMDYKTNPTVCVSVLKDEIQVQMALISVCITSLAVMKLCHSCQQKSVKCLNPNN